MSQIANKLDYHFETMTPSEFECILKCDTANRMFQFLLEQARHKVRDAGNMQLPDEFEIDPKYLNWVKTTIKKIVLKIRQEVAKDNIMISDYFVKKVKYKKKSHLVWQVEILLTGYYNKV